MATALLLEGKGMSCFNPCFNGFMDKWLILLGGERVENEFQPLF